MKITEELGEFVGAFIGDGFAGKYSRVRMIQFTGHPKDDSEYLKDKLIPKIQKIFFVSPHIEVRERALRITYYSREMYEKITQNLKLPSDKKSTIVKIPEIFLRRKKVMKVILRGIFDADGTIVWDKRKIYREPYPRLSLSTVSEKSARQISSLLKKLGFRVCFRKVKRKKETRNQAYYIELYRFDQLKKWVDEIGFLNPKHIKRSCPGSLTW